MGPGLQPGGPFSIRRVRRRASLPISGINITPLAGVMAVLIIIFMVAAPRMTVGVAIDANAALPQTESTAAGGRNQAVLSITVDGDGKIFLQNTEIGLEEVVSKLIALREAGGGAQVRVRGDKSASYGAITKVLVRIKEAGLPVILITDPQDHP